MFDTNEFFRNTGRYVGEHRATLAGKHVAWSFAGSFLYAAPTLAEVYDAMAALGREDFVTDFVDPLPTVAPPVPLSRAS